MDQREEQRMKFQSLKWWALAAVISFLVVGPCGLLAREAPMSLSSVQQSPANSALCSAIASKFPNPAAAGPSALNDPGVLSTPLHRSQAARTFRSPVRRPC